MARSKANHVHAVERVAIQEVVAGAAGQLVDAAAAIDDVGARRTDSARSGCCRLRSTPGTAKMKLASVRFVRVIPCSRIVLPGLKVMRVSAPSLRRERHHLRQIGDRTGRPEIDPVA